ncbi:MAG: Asp23/Gls24 family envelope stress response protein [Selenomonadaceae bacterium]|nr:Asp23/Gls24 family envelope stress response protein [Selenomonadaceae bacterium]MBQ3727726.1 Asp23/Gls24 family envelope stress response protein [Selenomonadaceae bacterium]MBQ9496984.1 Asp23/Gls24 family envelope stress response protein [Selenomonadaceae bacterium]MBR3499450.1 Asp23/Gls24 family envelope stress response protein [Selenomonadaceae bacterium]
MDVIALVGPSGTGKSHRALQVAREHNADTIIDDGILIKDGHIVAGESAKTEKSKIMAVRRAIFVLPGHAEQVSQAIQEVQPHRILVIGTSENMVQKIAKTLKLPPIQQIIRIEDIASRSEIATAQFHRLKEGKHIIPVPTIELKPHFSGFLVNPLQSIFKQSSVRRRKLGEKSIVRPVFSYYGKLIIDDKVVQSVVERIIKAREFVKSLKNVTVKHVFKGDEDRGLTISCEVVLSYGNHIPTLIRQTQSHIRDAVEFTTGMIVHAVDISVRALYVEQRRRVF